MLQFEQTEMAWTKNALAMEESELDHMISINVFSTHTFLPTAFGTIPISNKWPGHVLMSQRLIPLHNTFQQKNSLTELCSVSPS